MWSSMPGGIFLRSEGLRPSGRVADLPGKEYNALATSLSINRHWDTSARSAPFKLSCTAADGAPKIGSYISSRSSSGHSAGDPPKQKRIPEGRWAKAAKTLMLYIHCLVSSLSR
ncbi:hypothetical protein MTO96_015789 [Rhipicephalus appendiculatus]